MGNVSSRAQNNPYKALTKEEKEALAAKKAAKDQAKIDDAKAAEAAAEQAAKEAEVTAKSGVLTGLSKTEKGAN